MLTKCTVQEAKSPDLIPALKGAVKQGLNINVE
jgi:hypothetical protein